MLPLKSNWDEITTKAWSMRLWALGIVFIILDTSMPFFQVGLPAWFPLWLFGLLSGVFAAAGMVARVLVQENLPHG